MNKQPGRNLGLEIVRATEAAALVAGRWLGRGDPPGADQAAEEAMHATLDTVNMRGVIVVGEEGRHAESTLVSGTHVGVGDDDDPEMDVVVNPIEGVRLLAQGLPQAISVVGLAPRGTMWSPAPAVYMDKVVVDAEAAASVGTECLRAPPAWTLGVISRAMRKKVHNLTVFVLDRPRHQALIEDIRNAGARVLLRPDGDVAGALLAATPGSGVDALMGIGGTPEGVMAACAVKAVGGAMFGQLAPQSQEEREAVQDAGLDLKQVLSGDELVASDNIFFAATGITESILLDGVRYHATSAVTHSLVLRGKSGTRRIIHTDHRWNE